VNLPLKPIYLFADSQLLFWRKDGVLFLDSIRGVIDCENPKAAYIGASNDDDPDFYSIFEAAMYGIGISHCRMIRSTASPEASSSVDDADIILLSGGDVIKGWDVLVRSGLRESVTRKYYEGAILMGVSAGAVQLGLYGYLEGDLSSENLFDTFKLVPFIVSVHDEKEDWERLKKVIHLLGGVDKGMGIPTGGGMVYYADGSIEPVRYPLSEFSMKGESITQSLLFPGPPGDIRGFSHQGDSS